MLNLTKGIDTLAMFAGKGVRASAKWWLPLTTGETRVEEELFCIGVRREDVAEKYDGGGNVVIGVVFNSTELFLFDKTVEGEKIRNCKLSISRGGVTIE